MNPEPALAQALASHRFGLSQVSLASVGADPRAWVMGQLQRPALLDIRELPDSTSVTETTRRLRQMPEPGSEARQRLREGNQQALRLRYSGDPSPTDRESLYWLNVLEVPPVSAGAEQNNQIELAFRTRLRVFLRPKALPYPVSSAPAKLQWKLVAQEQGYALQATNPTPYHISLTAVDLLSEGKRFSKAPNKEPNDGLLMPAGDVKLFALPQLRDRPSGIPKVEFTTVSDYGARVRHSASLSPSIAR